MVTKNEVVEQITDRYSGMDVFYEAGIGPVYVQDNRVKIEISPNSSSVPYWKDILGFVVDIGYKDNFEVLRVGVSGQTSLDDYQLLPDFKNFGVEDLNEMNLGLHPYDARPIIYKEFGAEFNMADFLATVDSVIGLENLFSDKYKEEKRSCV